MGRALQLVGWAVMAMIAASILFGFNLPVTLFCGAMVVFAGACVLYHTSNVLYHYQTSQYVAAALALFASVALMFWYILQLVMRQRLGKSSGVGDHSDLPRRAGKLGTVPAYEGQTLEQQPTDGAEYDPLYLAGIEHFNVCDFYESHEVWEELWTDYSGPSRKFYQGLIQVAVALHHFGNGNIRGREKALSFQPGVLATLSSGP